MKETNKEEILNNTKADLLTNLKEELNNIKDSQEIYFHDIVSNSIDCNSPTDTHDAIKLIEYLGEEEYADEGVLDKSSINRFCVTMAYECLSNALFNDDFIQYLQNELNNETVTENKANIIIKKIDDELKKYDKVQYIENDSQVYITLDFKLSEKDFIEPFFNKKQIINLSDNSIKIMCSNDREHINKNAIVLDQMNKKPFRFYLMDRTARLDLRQLIRDLHKNTLTIKENNYSLNPKDYIEGVDVRHFKKKDAFIYLLNQMSNKLIELSEAKK